MNIIFNLLRAKPKFTALLVGCGDFTQKNYAFGLNKISNRLLCNKVLSRTKLSATNFVKKLKYEATVYESLEDAVNEVDVVIITTPNYLHMQQVSYALSKDKVVFCEKPLVNNLQDALLLKANYPNGKLMVGYNRRYSKRLNNVKKIVNKKIIGDIVSIKCAQNLNIGDLVLASSWLKDSSKSGGGVLHHAGVHLINYIIDFVGIPDYVSADYHNYLLPESCGEDTAFCKMIYDNGPDVQIEASYVNKVESNSEHIIIKGTNGSLYTDMKNSIIEITLNNGRKKQITISKDNTQQTIYREIKALWQLLSKNKLPCTDLEDTIKTLQVVEAMNKSAKSKQKIPIIK